MNTSKLLLAGMIAAAIASAPGALANDTEAQIKAREALDRTLNELNPQQGVTPPASVATQPKPAAPAPQPKPAPAPTAAPAPASPAAQVIASPASAPAPVEMPPVVAPPAESPAVVAAREQALRMALDQESFSAVPPPSSTGRATASQVDAAPVPKPAMVQSPAPTAAPKPAKVESPKGSEFKPLEAPPLPMNTDKQSRLAELLRKYSADEITPEQYHAERARILAAP